MAVHAAIDPRLAEAVRGVRALVLDADGVLVLKGAMLPGAAEALATLDRLAIPYRVVTNFSSAHRETLAARFAKGTGLPIDARHVITAASSAAALTAARHAGEALYVLCAHDARREFDGQLLLSTEEAMAPDARVGAVVNGDAGDDLTFRELDVAFRHLRAGAAFVAMHRNPWWLTPRGETLDSGALVAGLEFATGRRAIVAGTPSPVVFREAVAELARDLSARDAGAERSATGAPGGSRVPTTRLSRHDVLMVGDDPLSDVRAAQRVGLRAILVLTGKSAPADADRALAAARPPDAVAPSLPEVVAALATR